MLQAPQKSGQGQHGEIPTAYPAVAARAGTSQLCRGAVEVLQGLAGRLSVRHEGRIISSQEAPPSPVFLRNGHGGSESVPVRSSSANGLGEHWISTLEPLDSRAEDENGRGLITDGAATPGRPAAAPTRKPTFLQKERWKAIQKARRKGMSLRAIERELGIYRATIKKYTDAEGPANATIPGGFLNVII